VGGDKVDYPGEVATKTSAFPVTKAIINSAISTEAALYTNMDINNYYLGTPLGHYKYINIAFSMFPNRIIEENNVHDLVHNGYLYVEVRKGMYGLPQVGFLANIWLARHLAKHGYIPVKHTYTDYGCTIHDHSSFCWWWVTSE
jgi:hypothetical protein